MKVWHILVIQALLLWAALWSLLNVIWPWLKGVLQANGVKGL